ncbi:hypothetical protein BD779DRAFT_1673532 [Infundibulicybe gibba]|nr:hypothetical protein BD779DRAFT_1673532 [Infundibulicybe gibba]
MPGSTNFIVIASNGIHHVNINFCGCFGAAEPRDQLLEVGWWPASPIEPQTAATMELLRLFHVVNLQARSPPTDFYRSLEQLTDGNGLLKLPDRLAQWMLMVREWRHIKMAKRAGCGQDPAGIEATKQGELAILCRACPQPGINLPLGWERAPADVRWLYHLILAQDANFKIKGRLRSNDHKDPALGPGWATFVGNEDYTNHLSKFADQNEISHCVSFAALWAANTKGKKGLRARGIGSVSCARHEIFHPNGTGDLQEGERYSNMDYIFLSSVVATTLLMITVSYDIACQWSKHLPSRMKNLPECLHIPPNLRLQYRVPKFHLPAHVEKCHAPFSFNYTKWVGRTDGEGVERNWSSLNGTARCVAVMGPGGRQDTLDDFCNYSNWRKTVGLGDSLLRKLTLTIPQAILHHRAFEVFTISLHGEHPEKLREWEQQVQAWEVDPSKPCPYDLPREDITMADIKQQLAEEEHQRVESGEKSTIELSPSQFIIEGLQIEEVQRSIRAEATKSDSTIIQATSLQTRRTTSAKQRNTMASIKDQHGLP